MWVALGQLRGGQAALVGDDAPQVLTRARRAAVQVAPASPPEDDTHIEADAGSGRSRD